MKNTIPRFDGEPCILSPIGKPNSRGGYIRVPTGGGKYKMAHRIACTEAHGRAPWDKPIAGHTCGTPACIRPSHLFWASVKENMAVCRSRQRHMRGEEHHKAKLTWEQVRRIRKEEHVPAEHGRRSNVMALANKYGVSYVTIYAIVKGQTWKED